MVADASVVADGGGNFHVATSAFTYDQPGNYVAGITVHDNTTGTDLFDFSDIAVSSVAATGAAVSMIAQGAAPVEVATFTVPDPSRVADDFAAQVTWGDKSVETDSQVTLGADIPPGVDPNDTFGGGRVFSPATIARDASGVFHVYAGHPYGAVGTYDVTVVLDDKKGAQASLGANAPPIRLSTTATATVAPAARLFSPGPTTDTNLTPFAAVAADFNRDGRSDLVMNYGDSFAVQVFLGAPGGGFEPAVTLPVQSGSRALAVGDFNGDGIPDIAIDDAGFRRLDVFLGVGDGTFRSPLASPVQAYPSRLAVADFDGDGKVDLAMLETAATTADIVILRGRGDGTFAPLAATYAASPGTQTLAAGDIDGDGRPDLAVGNLSSSSVSVLRNAGDGAFVARPDVGVGYAPGTVALADFDGDGKADLVVGNIDNSGTISLARGRGDGTFGAATTYSAGAGTFFSQLAVADLNGDGRADVAVPGGGSIAVLFGQDDGTLSAPVSYAASAGAKVVVSADLDGIGTPDLIAGGDRTIATLSNASPPRPNAPPAVAPIADRALVGGQGLAVVASATDPDKGQHLTYSLGAGSPAGAAIDPSTGRITWTAPVVPGSYTFSVHAIDDGTPAFDGSTAFTVTVTKPPPALAPIADRVAVAGRAVVLTATATDADPTARLVFSLEPGAPAEASIDARTGLFVWALPLAFRPTTISVRVADASDLTLFTTRTFVVRPIATPGDFDGDGRADLYVVRPGDDRWLIRPSSGSLRVDQMGDPAAGDLPVTADFDGDGRSDLAVVRPGTDQWFIRLSSGGFRIDQMGDPGTRDVPVAADFDGDGKSDDSLAEQSAPARDCGQWLMNGSPRAGLPRRPGRLQH